jgi:hypothetical protein
MRGQELCWELNGEWKKRMRIEKEGKAADGGRPRRTDAHHPIPSSLFLLILTNPSTRGIKSHHLPSFPLFLTPSAAEAESVSCTSLIPSQIQLNFEANYSYNNFF